MFEMLDSERWWINFDAFCGIRQKNQQQMQKIKCFVWIVINVDVFIIGNYFSDF